MKRLAHAGRAIGGGFSRGPPVKRGTRTRRPWASEWWVSRWPPLAAGAPDFAAGVKLGIHHEQQHQELIVTDLKHAWAANPLCPIYCDPEPLRGTPPAGRWVPFPQGLASIGHRDGRGGAGDFAFDNESPR